MLSSDDNVPQRRHAQRWLQAQRPEMRMRQSGSHKTRYGSLHRKRMLSERAYPLRPSPNELSLRGLRCND